MRGLKQDDIARVQARRAVGMAIRGAADRSAADKFG